MQIITPFDHNLTGKTREDVIRYVEDWGKKLLNSYTPVLRRNRDFFELGSIRVKKPNKGQIRAKRSFQHQECLWGPKIRNP